MQVIAASEYRRRLAEMLPFIPGVQVSFKADTTAASPALANLTSVAEIEEGDVVSGPGIPAGTTIIQVGPGNAATMSANATASALQVSLTAQRPASGTAEIHLFKAPFAGGPEPTPASFTECDFTTYTFLPMPNPIGPYTQPDGSAQVDFPGLSWVLTADPATPNPQVFGYWVDYVVGGTRVVSFWENFPAPMPMVSAGQAISLSVPTKAPDPGSVTVLG